MPTRKEWERREKQRRGEDPALPEELATDGDASGAATGSAVAPMGAGPENNPAFGEDPKDAYAGRADQDVTHNTGTGAGGATEYGGGNKNHPSRRIGKPDSN